MIQHTTSSHTVGFLCVARGDARGEQRQQTSPSYLAVFFQDNTWIWIIKVQSRWENVNEPQDKRRPALIWWRRNEEPAKLSQDHVRADTWETDEVEAIVLMWMQIRRDGERKQGRWPTSSQAQFVAGGVVGSAGGTDGDAAWRYCNVRGLGDWSELLGSSCFLRMLQRQRFKLSLGVLLHTFRARGGTGREVQHRIRWEMDAISSDISDFGGGTTAFPNHVQLAWGCQHTRFYW